MADASRKAHFLVVLSFILLNYWVEGQCPAGKFGRNCQIDCQCSGACDPFSGECLTPYSCSGPKCRKKNIARNENATVTQSSDYCEGSGESRKCYRASLAVDGSSDQDMSNGQGCSSTLPGSYNEWTITLGRKHSVYSLTIFARQDCCTEDLNGFSVEVGRTECYKDRTGVPSGGIIHVTCDKPVYGDTVTVKLARTEDVKLTLCEVQIWECAAGFFGKDCEHDCHCYRGVECNVDDGKCPEKKKRCARGWKGDNCATECPDNSYGTDCSKTCGHCWNDKVCAKENGFCPSDTDFTCKAGFSPPRCQKDCDDGKWGEDCKFSCGHCEGDVVCDKNTGVCPNQRCDKGWTGLRCKQDNSPCPDKKYGTQCEEDCGQCYGDKTCNRTTGHCPAGNPFCQPGFTGSLCKSECNPGLYGVDCQLGCGHCYNGKSCDIRSGACPNQPLGRRCSPGWKGTECSQECPEGWYGVDCELECSKYCRDKRGCNKTTGACPRLRGEPACEPGWSGPSCNRGCEFGTYGSDCLQQCGRCYMGSCNSENGTCYQGKENPRCQEGWHSAKCDQPCTEGTFGADCTRKCHCKGGVACEKTGLCPAIATGERPCEPGYIGDTCDTTCSSNLYGEGCRSVCGHCRDQRGCNVRTGACPLVAEQSVCEDGWSGDLCITNARHDQDNDVIYICVSVVVTLVVIAAIVVFVIMRRRYIAKSHRRQENGHDPQQLFNLLPAEERNGGPPKPEKKPKRGFLRGKLTDEYCNVSDTFTSRAVAVDELLKFISDQNSVDGFKSEHESLPKGLTANTYEANKPENKPKNRFQGIVAYDHSRVVLNLKDGIPSSDYINACFVHGYTEQFRYIASQGPTALILDDFWRMVWQFDCTKIIMLTNLVEDARRKCDMYWPSSGEKEYGDISVTLLETESLADFVIRTLSVRNIKDETMPSRIVKQFHFTVWPDHGVPNYPTALVHFREKVHTTNTTSTGPLIVHCSAGIGRTGTYIGLDYLIDQAKAENKVDVLQCVVNMRKQRVNMIQTEEQYAFLYEALAEAVLLTNMSIPASVFEEKYKELQSPHPETGNTGLQEQFQMLATMSPTVTAAQCSGGSLPENKGRNRDSSILPVENWRPFLSTPAPDTTDYINAVFLPAYRDNHAFIATQMPLPHTTVDMWRLVYGQKSHCILMLNDLEALEEEKSVYWPYDNTTEGMFGPFKVTVVGVEKKATFDIQTMTLVYTKMPDKEPLKVRQIVAKFWKEGEDVPAKAEDLVSLIEEVERWRQQSGEGPVIVHCMNGADKSGLYCAVSSVLERLKIDQEVNILQTVKQMRINRPQVIRNLKQYQFCFEAVLAFLESFQTYSNFK